MWTPAVKKLRVAGRASEHREQWMEEVRIQSDCLVTEMLQHNPVEKEVQGRVQSPCGVEGLALGISQEARHQIRKKADASSA